MPLTSIPQTLVPGAYVEFDASRAVGGLQIKPHRVLVVGQRLSSGTIAALVPQRVQTPDDAAVFFGTGSMLHRMAQFHFAANRSTETWFVAFDDDGGGVAAARTFNVTGTAAKSGTLALYIGGRRVAVAVTAGDTATAVALAVKNACDDVPDLAIVATNSAATFTLTALHKGALGNSIDVRLNWAPEDVKPEGIGITEIASAPNTLTGGSGDPDVSDLWPILGEEQYDEIAWPYSDSTSIASLDTELESRWGSERQIEGMAFLAKRGDHTALVTFGDTQNSKHATCLGFDRPLEPLEELAAAYCAIAAIELAKDPARPLQTLVLTGIKAPASLDRFTSTEQNLLLIDGIATWIVDSGGVVRIQRAASFYQENALGAADPAYRDTETHATLSYLRWDFRTFMLLRYPRHKLRKASQADLVGQAIMTEKQGRSEAIARFQLWEAAGLVEDLDQFKRDLVVEINAADPNRLDFSLPANLCNQLRVIAATITFLL